LELSFLRLCVFGNQLHLLSDALLEMSGVVWLYDLMVIITQSITLNLLGSFCLIDMNRNITIGFLELLMALYIIDMAWVATQWILDGCLRGWRRELIPWGWAI
jgi:hypothetical protein